MEAQRKSFTRLLAAKFFLLRIFSKWLTCAIEKWGRDAVSILVFVVFACENLVETPIGSILSARVGFAGAQTEDAEKFHTVRLRWGRPHPEVKQEVQIWVSGDYFNHMAIIKLKMDQKNVIDH